MNLPYVKKYDTKGNLLNPITRFYSSEFDNRAKRREHENRTPFHGNGKNFHLTVVKTIKYLRHRQIIKLKNGETKTIEHYLLRN